MAQDDKKFLDVLAERSGLGVDDEWCDDVWGPLYDVAILVRLVLIAEPEYGLWLEGGSLQRLGCRP